MNLASLSGSACAGTAPPFDAELLSGGVAGDSEVDDPAHELEAKAIMATASAASSRFMAAYYRAR